MSSDVLPAYRLDELYIWQDVPGGDLYLGNAAAVSARNPVNAAPEHVRDSRPAVTDWAFDQVLEAAPDGPKTRIRLNNKQNFNYFLSSVTLMHSPGQATRTLDVIDTGTTLSIWEGARCLQYLEGADDPLVRETLVVEHHLRCAWYAPEGFGGPGFIGTMHGACLELEGACVALIGNSGAGKSTLAAYLSTQGAAYVSDDIIPFNGQGRVFRYPVPPNLKSPSWPLFEAHYPELRTGEAFPKGDQLFKTLTSAPFIAAETAPAPRLFVMVHYRPGAPLRHVEIGLDEMMARLPGREFYVAAGQLGAFGDMLKAARVVGLQYSDWDEAVRFIRTGLGLHP
ncbi:hypothetical protein ACS3SW_20195 [Roseobacteraceae bacterium S113]